VDSLPSTLLGFSARSRFIYAQDSSGGWGSQYRSATAYSDRYSTHTVVHWDSALQLYPVNWTGSYGF
jgi:hypothetical protein